MELDGNVIRMFKYVVVLCLVLARDLQLTAGRSTNTQDVVETNVEKSTEEEVKTFDFTVHILTKRDTSLIQNDEAPEGRTFKASDPLDPNSPSAVALTELGGDLFDDFETKSTIFQPTIDNENEPSEDVKTSNDDSEEKPEPVEVPDSASLESRQSEERSGQTQNGKYSAQQPYTETRRTAGVPDGYDQTFVQRRVVLTGRSGEPTSETTQYTRTDSTGTQYVGNLGTQYGTGTQSRQYSGTQYSSQGRQYTGSSSSSSGSQYPTSGSQYQTSGSRYPTSGSQYQTSGSRYPTSGSQYQTSGRQYPTSGSQYSTSGRQYSSSGSQYPSSASNTRGAYYDGTRYIDDNGHYIDENGRHLDATGRYYDTSGRYQDALITRTITYESGPSSGRRYVDSSGQGYRYVDQSSSNSRQYTGGSQTGYGSGTGYTSQSGTSSTNTRGSGYSSTQIGGTPINSFGGTQFYSGGAGYPATYNPVVSQISSDPNCPTRDNIRVTINGLSCANAVSQLGHFVCYNYERVSTECCERCLQVKRADQVGCEYGDRSSQCRNLNAFDCYHERNRQVCCKRCSDLESRRPGAITSGGSTCQFGDHTPRCQDLVQRSHLCYLPENQRLCCDTCPRLANQAEPDCKWGNQNPEICEPFDANRRIRLNCYLPAVRDICCATCRSLRGRIRENIPGCTYGDQPIQISTARGVLDCGEYIRQYGVDNCNGGEIAQKCCYTCYRYQSRTRG